MDAKMASPVQSIVKIFKQKVREDPVKYKCLAEFGGRGLHLWCMCKVVRQCCQPEIPPRARPWAAKGGEAIRHCKRLPWMRYRLAYQGGDACGT